MIPIWTGQARSKMHLHGISQGDLAEVMGVTEQYISAIFNGKKTPKGAKERVNNALDIMISKLKEAKGCQD